MTTLREAAQQALEALEEIADEVFSPYDNKLGDAITALRAALAQEQEHAEPVAWMLTEREKYGGSVVVRKHKPKTYDSNWWTLTPLYTCTPPQRTPLTNEEIVRIGLEARAVEGPHILPFTFARAIERAHGITGPEDRSR